MLTIKELDMGFGDATNYSMKENKQMLNQVFVNKDIIQKIFPSHISFIVGDKGTGKTAYAVYISNNSIDNTQAALHFIMETEYQKFVQLKAIHSLDLSDYTQIWRVIIYLLMAMKISEHMKDRRFFPSLNPKFKALINAIDDFYNHAFSPEIITAMTFAEESQASAQLVNKHVGSLSGSQQTSSQFTGHKYQTNLLYLQKQFEDAFKTLKLTDNYLLFIDGIDVRPQNIPHEEYLDCVRGLANAIWYVNMTFFQILKIQKEE